MAKKDDESQTNPRTDNRCQKAHLLLFYRPNHCKSMIVLNDRNSISVSWRKFQVISSTLYLELTLDAHSIRGMGWTDFFERFSNLPSKYLLPKFHPKQSDQRLCMMGWNGMNDTSKSATHKFYRIPMHKYPGSELMIPLKRIAQAERDTCQGIVARWQEQSLTHSLPAKFEGTKVKNKTKTKKTA